MTMRNERDRLIQERASMVMQLIQIEAFLKDPLLSEYMRAGIAKSSVLVDPLTGNPVASEIKEGTLEEAREYFGEQLRVNENEFRTVVSEVQSSVQNDEHS